MSPAAAANREPATDAGRHWYCQQATAPGSVSRKLYCIEARGNGGICGPEAKLFKPEPREFP